MFFDARRSVESATHASRLENLARPLYTRVRAVAVIVAVARVGPTQTFWGEALPTALRHAAQVLRPAYTHVKLKETPRFNSRRRCRESLSTVRYGYGLSEKHPRTSSALDDSAMSCRK